LRRQDGRRLCVRVPLAEIGAARAQRRRHDPDAPSIVPQCTEGLGRVLLRKGHTQHAVPCREHRSLRGTGKEHVRLYWRRDKVWTNFGQQKKQKMFLDNKKKQKNVWTNFGQSLDKPWAQQSEAACF
jgi:hypothetical protein